PQISPEEVKAPQAVFNLLERMMSFDPFGRTQTPAQLLDEIKGVRRELEGKPTELKAGTTHSLFLIEPHPKLQETIRDRFKELGFRVMLSAEPSRAFLRFQQQPFDVLVIDAGSAGEEGLVAFRQVIENAHVRHVSCQGVLILSEEQA